MDNLTRFPNGIESFLVDTNQEEKETNYTVVSNDDSGKTFSSVSGVVFTLPGIVTGNVFTFINLAPNGTTGISISPAAADGITYAGSAIDDKDLINTLATSQYGDSVTLASLDGTTAWQVVAIRGIWAKEA